MTPSGRNRKTNERRLDCQRRLEDDRRQVDQGAPERRYYEDRRQQNLGPPERRVRTERRDAELGPPPGWRDRRRFAERRLLDVTEVCFEEWIRLRMVQASHISDPAPEEEHHDALGRVILRD